MSPVNETTKTGFCIYVDTICQGPIPVERDDEGNFYVHPTRKAAEREIVEDIMERLRQYLEGEREFDDDITVEEYVVPVSVAPNGTITDEDGRTFGKGSW